MKWLTKTNRPAPQDVVDAAEAASKRYGVPVGLILGIIEEETDFRAGLVSSAGAVGYMQIKRKLQPDYERYAGRKFDAEGLDGIDGCTAALKTFATGKSWAVKRGVTGDDAWRFAACVHRYGQGAPESKTPRTAHRVLRIEAHMARNGYGYGGKLGAAPAAQPATAQTKPAPAPSGIPAKAAKWALSKVGCKYSQPQRAQEGIFDCSSLVARAYKAQGAPFTVTGKSIPRSCEEVYDDSFRLIWPASYAIVGKQLGRLDVIPRAAQAGDLQLLCTDRATSRANKITHITMVADAKTIVHARGTKYGVRTDPIDTYNGKVCALLRYDPTCPLRLGHKGDRVRALQTKLNAKGAGLVVDGDYGRKTAAAVAKYGIKE